MSISWENLATRAVKGVLAIKDVKPSHLHKHLLDIKVVTRENAVAEMISKDAVSLVTFMQILKATHYVIPTHWEAAFALRASWEKKAAELLLLELNASPLDMDELLSLMERFNAGHSQATLRKHIETGCLSLADFFAMLYCLRSDSAQLFLQKIDINAVASLRRN